MRILILLLSLACICHAQSFGNSLLFRAAGAYRASSSDSGWSENHYPTNIPGRLAREWWNGSFAQLNGDGLVTNWPAAVNTSYSAAQSTSASYPTGTLATAINGQKFVSFDGVDDYLINANASLLSSEEFEIVIVWKWFGGGGAEQFVTRGSNNTGYAYSKLDSGVAKQGSSTFGDIAGTHAAIAGNIEVWNYWKTAESGGYFYSASNGVMVGTNASGGTAGIYTGIIIGATTSGSSSLHGAIGEICWYQTNLGGGGDGLFFSTERSNLFNYHTNKWR